MTAAHILSSIMPEVAKVNTKFAFSLLSSIELNIFYKVK